MNSEIERIFKNFQVEEETIPVSFLVYKGNSEKYITYQSTSDEPVLACDDEIETSVIEYDFDIYSKGNYLKLLEEVKKILKSNGWLWVGDSPDMYEQDTGFYHKTTTFQKERSVI